MVVEHNSYGQWPTMTTDKYMSTFKLQSDGHTVDHKAAMNLELYNIETATMYVVTQESYETALPDGHVSDLP